LQQHKTKKGIKKPPMQFPTIERKKGPKKTQGGVCSNRKNKGKKTLRWFDAIKGAKKPKG
jgi:hypothetical protein